MSAQSDYWREAVMEAFEGINRFDLVKDLTKEQLDDIGEALATSSECQSMAFGWDVASANRYADIQRTEDNLRKEIRKERDKVTCRECGGQGRLRYNAGPWAVDTGCMKCNGEGRHDP
jgi:DnaJ-class molecular chaperone